jgi:uncharacterized spore protein YtfJ
MEPSEGIAELAQLPEHSTAASCFGTPSTVGDHVVIPVAEVMYGLGFAWGSGHSSEGEEGGGGGGGGGARTRGVAVIHASPSGVEVHPIRDETAISLATLAFASAATAIVARTLNKLIRG